MGFQARKLISENRKIQYSQIDRIRSYCVRSIDISRLAEKNLNDVHPLKAATLRGKIHGLELVKYLIEDMQSTEKLKQQASLMNKK